MDCKQNKSKEIRTKMHHGEMSINRRPSVKAVRQKGRFIHRGKTQATLGSLSETREARRK